MSNQQAGTGPLADPQTPIESAVKNLARTQQELHIAVEQLARRLAPVLVASKPDAAPSTGRALGASPLLDDLFHGPAQRRRQRPGFGAQQDRRLQQGQPGAGDHLERSAAVHQEPRPL